MSVLSLEEAARLKALVMETFSVQLHFHDGCGGQYFSVDEPADEKMQEWIANYAKTKKLHVEFADDRLGFYLILPKKDERSC